MSGWPRRPNGPWIASWAATLCLVWSAAQVWAATNNGVRRVPSAARKVFSATTNSIPKTWTFDGQKINDALGYSAVAAGDVNGDGFADVIISAPGHDNGRGRIMIFHGSPHGLESEPDWTSFFQPLGEPITWTATTAGDVNGDGFTDVLVGCDWENQSTGISGSRFQIYFGSATGLCASAGWTLSNSVSGFELTGLGEGIGDVNGDGFGDIALAGSDFSVAESNRECVLVFYGSFTGPHGLPDWMAHAEQTNSFFGRPIAARPGHPIGSAGDVNGDGYGDLIIGSSLFDGRYRDGGKAYVFHGSPTGLSKKPIWTAIYDLPTKRDVDEAYEQYFGQSVCGVGDVNGDGFDDVIVGAVHADHGDINEGLVFAFYGSATGLSARPQWTVESNHPHALFGWSAFGAGDVNGDGFADVVIGAPYANDGQVKEGAIALYFGSKQGLGEEPGWTHESDRYEAMLGLAGGGAGDVNGDGFADFLVSGANIRTGDDKTGRAMLFYGQPKMPGDFHWRIDKPFLTAIQQRLDVYRLRWGWGIYLIPWSFITLTIVVAFLIVQRRLRRRIALLLDENRQLVQSTERQRLARDLHDDIGARLTSISVMTEVVGRDAAQTESNRALARMLGESAQEVLESMERIIWSVHPGNDTLEGLVRFIAHYAGPYFAPTGIELVSQIPVALPELAVSAEIRKHLFLVIKEAMNNVAKHARATKVHLTITIQNATLTVVLADNGIGLNPNTDQKSRHGLRNMRERMTEIGGEMKIESSPATGTQVTLRVNLSKA